MTGSFLSEPPVSSAAQALDDEDLAEGGYVGKVSRLWAHQPDAELAASLPAAVRAAVRYGRPVAQNPG